MKKNPGIWPCLIPAVLILAALLIVGYMRGSRPKNGEHPTPQVSDIDLLFKSSATYLDLVKAAAASWNNDAPRTPKVKIDDPEPTELDFIIVHNRLADGLCGSGSGFYKIVPKKTVIEQPAIVILKSGVEKLGGKHAEFLDYMSKKIVLPTEVGLKSIGDIGDVNDEKREWETVFNDARRLDKKK